MTTPDRRPIGALTPEILSSSSHWCLLWCGRGLLMPTADIEINETCIFACGMVFGYGRDARSTCYPCTLHPNGRVVPECWPVAGGEEEIEGWEYVGLPDTLTLRQSFFAPSWWQFDRGMESQHLNQARPGFHPAPRKGKTGPVWVWEADKC